MQVVLVLGQYNLVYSSIFACILRLYSWISYSVEDLESQSTEIQQQRLLPGVK